ncbi:hypothetical protein ACS0TY_002542 [Phlomoides rotata]
MAMEVMISSPLDSACTTPYMSAPSSPKGTPNFYYSVPASPSAFFRRGDGVSAVPFNWEDKPGIPKSHISTATSSNYGDAEEEELDDTDFAFDFSGHLERASLPADELFDGGKIKPLKPPPRFQYDHNRPLDSPKSPRSPKRFIREAFSPKIRAEIDPFTAALKHTRNDSVQENGRRGRERVVVNTSNSRNKSSRSLSPYRVSDLLFDPETNQEKAKDSSSSAFSSFWYKKWKIKDLLLFRSASESRAKDKEEQLKKPRQDEVKNSSFRSTDSVGSGSSRRRSGTPISAHELHYTVNRAFSEEMRKRTSLPYRQGFLGCLGFHPTVPEISKSLNPSRG